MAALMREKRREIRYLVERAEELASRLQARPRAQVLCHADVHAGNLLLARDGSLNIVDWDDLILAPREQDLMFAGGGVGGIWNSEREVALFYQGYGPVEVDLAALAYYRLERVVIDIAEFGKQLLLSPEGGEDREQAYRYFAGQFAPGEAIAMAMRTDRRLRESEAGQR
jgi:spectinomycin phosphotransferase